MKNMVNMLKWFFIGWLVTFLVFEAMVYMKVAMASIATLFQIIAGILLGGLWMLKAQAAGKSIKA